MKKPKTGLSVRFWHPNKDFGFLSSALGLKCERSWIAGSPRQTPIGKPLPGTYSESYWVSTLHFPSTSGFRKKFVSMLRRLKKAEKICRDIKESGGTIELYLWLPGSVNIGDTIESSLLNEMVKLGVDLSIEVMPGV